MKEGEGFSRRAHTHDPDTDDSGVMARGKGGRDWVGVGKVGASGDICNRVNNKNKENQIHGRLKNVGC